MTLFALGPLRLSREELWTLSWGELDDRRQAWMYAEHLETRRRAQLAAWLLNGSGKLKHPVAVEDLAGCWVDGRVMGKDEYRRRLKEKVRARKEGRSNG